MRYPKMIYEIIEAIEMNFSDHPEVKTDCMLYLYNALAREEDIGVIEKWFQEEQRCPNCGEPLVYHTYQEEHSETDPISTELITISYCPYCLNEDIKGTLEDFEKWGD